MSNEPTPYKLLQKYHRLLPRQVSQKYPENRQGTKTYKAFMATLPMPKRERRMSERKWKKVMPARLEKGEDIRLNPDGSYTIITRPN